MYSSVATKLPLATFAQFMHINPLHFAQVYFKPTNSETPRSNCDVVLPQYGWQDSDAVSREEVGQAIRDAEDAIEAELGFHLLPSWEVNEWQATSRAPKPEWFNSLSQDARGFPESVKAQWGHIISGGIRATTLVGDDAAIAWSDADGDGYDETGTVTATVDSGQDPGEIRVYYPDKGAVDAWEIKPITVSISGTTATITFRRENCVLESLQEALEIAEVAGETDANFLTAVDVYRVYNSAATMATLMWSDYMGICGCGVASCTVCQYTVQTACLNIKGDPRDAHFQYRPGTYDSTTDAYTTDPLTVHRQPDIVRLYYYSGYQDKRLSRPQQEMERSLQRAVAYLAASMLDRPVCTCSTREWAKWQEDLAFSGGADELASYNLADQDLRCPWGTRRGAIEAWRLVRRPTGPAQALARVAIAP